MPERKTKLDNPKIAEGIAQMIALGLSLHHACLAVGVSYDHARTWIIDARETGEPKKVHFLEQIEGAKAKGIASHAANILKAAQGYDVTDTRIKTRADGSTETTVINRTILPDWRASLEFLQRRDPGNWGLKSTVQLTVNWEESLRAQKIDPQLLADSMMKQLKPILQAGAEGDGNESDDD